MDIYNASESDMVAYYVNMPASLICNKYSHN